jgi:hypothetical protein
MILIILNMIIGGNFNKKCEQLLLIAWELSGHKLDETLPVVEINKQLNCDRNEMRNYLEFLNDRKWIKIDSIGGPMLYGHISITKKGEAKILELVKESEK